MVNRQSTIDTTIISIRYKIGIYAAIDILWKQSHFQIPIHVALISQSESEGCAACCLCDTDSLVVGLGELDLSRQM